MCVQVLVKMYAHVCRGPKLRLDAFLSYSLFIEAGSLTEPEACGFSLSSWLAWLRDSMSLPLECWSYRWLLGFSVALGI